MKMLLIYVPSRRNGLSLPYGLLYVASIIKRCGHEAIIFDPYLNDVGLKEFDSGDFSSIDDIIRMHAPAIVGYGGIATSYGRTKKLSHYLKTKYPQILQIAGGCLASVYNLLLTMTAVNVVFHGEAENSLPHFLRMVENDRSFYDTAGISYLKEGEIVSTPLPEQIKDLDSIPIPSFDFINIDRYINTTEEWLASYDLILRSDSRYEGIIRRLKGQKRYIIIMTSRGCTHRCSFCYRHFQGYRQHSVDYVIKYIKYMKQKYSLDGFHFGDELFNADPKWVYDFCDALEKEKLDIFYLIGGARVDRMDANMLKRLKETGCVCIFYGQESGSDVILKEYRKGVSRQKNKEITLLTAAAGIFSAVQLVIGSPCETDETIKDTISFLKEVSAYVYSINYLIPLPGTPIWKYVEATNRIKDVETYLDETAEYGGGATFINLTDEADIKWRRWGNRIRISMRLEYIRHKYPKREPFYRILYGLKELIGPFIPVYVKRLIPSEVRNFF